MIETTPYDFAVVRNEFTL